jgi:retron-type reverse transcriptase
MTNNQSEINEWISVLTERVKTKSSLKSAIAYVTDLSSRGFPPIFDFEHLSSLTGINRIELAQILETPEIYYRSFSISKRSGGERLILAPFPVLLTIQKWIKKNIVDHIPLSDAAHGFVKRRSIITFAKEHTGQSSLLHLDIRNFFPSITSKTIYGIFRQIGYPPNISLYLSKLCSYNGHLPQGAPTSPGLSNIVSIHFDRRLLKLAESNKITYSRYADNLVFSGPYVAFSLISTIEKILGAYGFSLNFEKTYLSTGKRKRIIVGISVSDLEIKLPRDTKRAIRQEVHYLIKNGFFAHTSKIGIRDPIYMERLFGKLQFWRQLEPTNGFVLNALSSVREMQDSLDWKQNN